MRRISGRNHSLRSGHGLSRRQLSSAIAVLACALHLHFSSLHHGDYRSREDKPKSRTKKLLVWPGVKSTFEFHVPHAPRPAEWGAILFLCLPALTRPGLDLGLSRTGQRARFGHAHHNRQYTLYSNDGRVEAHKARRIVSADMLAHVCQSTITHSL